MGRPPNYPKARTRPYSVHVRNAETQSQHPNAWASYLANAVERPGWSVARLAREVGVHPGTIFRWLNGSTTNVGAARVRRVAQVLGDDPENALRAAGAQAPQETADEGAPDTEEWERHILDAPGLSDEEKRFAIAVIRANQQRGRESAG